MVRVRRKTAGKKASVTDWQEVRKRMDAAADLLNQVITPEKAKQILKARAQELARETGREETAVKPLEILEFLLAYETYGIELSYVCETVPLKDITPVPCTPPFVLGLINVRGRIVSVLDIKKFFDLPEKGLTDLNKVIIVRNNEMEFGILVDVICGVRTILPAELQSSLATLTGIREEYLKGVTSDSLVVLDGKKLLMDRNIIIFEEIAD